MVPEVQQASDTDFIRFLKMTAPPPWWRGKCIKKGTLVKAMAGVLLSDDNRIFVFMDLRGTGRFPFVYRHALRFLHEVSEEVGGDAIHALCDENYPQARNFMIRLGFEKTDEEMNDERVWKWQVSEQS